MIHPVAVHVRSGCKKQINFPFVNDAKKLHFSFSQKSIEMRFFSDPISSASDSFARLPAHCSKEVFDINHQPKAESESDLETLICR